MPTGIYKRTGFHKKLLSDSLKGHVVLEETRRKISEKQKGKPRKTDGFFKGKHHTEETKRKISLVHKGNKYNLGRRLSIETKKRLSESHKNPSQETRQKLRDWNIQHPNRKYSNTGIELKMKELLNALEIHYIHQYPIKNTALVDFYIPSKNLIIECDGCYWHGCPGHFPERHTDKDEIKTEKLESLGYKVIRFWEHEINNMKVLTI